MFGKKNNEASGSVPGRRQQANAPTHERATQTDLSNRYAFRRNRTLTGSSSANIASSNELNAELRSPRAHVHHLTNLRRRLLLYFAGVAMVSFGLYVLVSQLVASTAISIAGVAPLSSNDQQEYQQAFDSYYAARPAERFQFLLDKTALLSHVQSSKPEVAAFAIEPGSAPGEASVIISARRPIARWSIDGNNQYVDGDGIVFSKTYFTDPELQIVDNSGLQTASNKLVASNRFLGFIGKVIAKSSGNGLSVAKVTIPTLTTRQVAVTLEGQETEYKLSVDRSAGDQVEDIARINKYLAANKLTPGYVDVRITGKAFYK